MPRLSPITFGISLLLLLTSGAFVLIVSRAKRQAGREGDLIDIDGSTPGPEPARSLPILGLDFPRTSPQPVSAAIRHDDEAAATTRRSDWSGGQRRRPPSTGESFVMNYQRYSFVRRADAFAFERLRVVEPQREAIRKINVEYRLAPEAFSGLTVEERSERLERSQAARRAAIEIVLGPAAAKDFFLAESSVNPQAVDVHSHFAAPAVGHEGTPLAAESDGGADVPSPRTNHEASFLPMAQSVDGGAPDVGS